MAMLRWLLVSAVMAYGLVSCSDSATVPSPDLSSADPLVADIVQRSMQRVRNKRGATAAWNDLGRACYANGYVSEAEEAFTQSLRIDANQPKAVYLRGMVRRDAFDLAGCLADFVVAMELDPQSAHLRWRAAWVAMENGNLPWAVELADAAMLLSPEDRNARRVRARLYLESDTPEKGVALLEPIRAANPADRDVLWLLTRLMRASGRAAEASELSAAAGTATPFYSDPWVQWAMEFKANPRMQSKRVLAMLAKGELGTARKALDRFQAYYPDDPNGVLLEGMLLAASGKTVDAIQVFEQLAIDEPEWSAPWQQLGMLRLRVGAKGAAANPQARVAAIADLNQAIERDANLSAARGMMARLHAMSREWGPAAEHFAVCVETDPLEQSHRTNLAVALFQLGRGDEAVAVLDQADVMFPEPPPAALATRARAELSRGNLAGAQSALVRLIELAPEHPAIPKIRSQLQNARS
ncbi:MAG: hypothetical protein HOI89_03205 [Phycisphaerae bacterium]|nr:hypothetical protein [Phycisphaerae bacterium]